MFENQMTIQTTKKSKMFKSSIRCFQVFFSLVSKFWYRTRQLDSMLPRMSCQIFFHNFFHYWSVQFQIQLVDGCDLHPSIRRWYHLSNIRGARSAARAVDLFLDKSNICITTGNRARWCYLTPISFYNFQFITNVKIMARVNKWSRSFGTVVVCFGTVLSRHWKKWWFNQIKKPIFVPKLYNREVP